MSFIKSKPTTFKNTPVGIVAADTGLKKLKQAQAQFAAGIEKIMWAEAKDSAIKKDISGNRFVQEFRNEYCQGTASMSGNTWSPSNSVICSAARHFEKY